MTYPQLIKQIQNLCKNNVANTTTMIDYYGLLREFPGNDILENDIYQQIDKLENNLKNSVERDNFIPYLSMHEFEAILFSDPDAFSSYGDNVVKKIADTLKEVDGNPELINNSFETAPSKRIAKIINGYEKVVDSDKIAKQTSITKIMGSGKHFSEWITKLKNI